jgi:hypothetical protein
MPVRDDFHKVHQAQRKGGSLKLHEVMTKPDRKPVQSLGARTSYEIQVAPPPVIEPKAEPTIGAAPVGPSADVVQIPPPAVIEPKVPQGPQDPAASAESLDEAIRRLGETGLKAKSK